MVSFSSSHDFDECWFDFSENESVFYREDGEIVFLVLGGFEKKWNRFWRVEREEEMI